MHYAKTASKVREQIIKFSGELSAGWPKVVRRFLAEALYGIQARQSLRLTEIARALKENISLKKTQYRLSRQLGREDLETRLLKAILGMGARHVDKKTLLIIDITDIRKKYARKMEHIACIRDGSEKSLGNGYWALSVIGAEAEKTSLVPLYGSLWSQKSPDYRSENLELRRAIQRVSLATEKKGIWVMDRGGDRDYIFDFHLDNKLSFLIRLKKTRDLIYREGEHNVLELALTCPLPYAERIVKQEKGKETIYNLQFGSRPVRLPGRKEPLTLVVIRGFGKEPMMLLTDCRVTKSRKSLWWVVKSYLTRWRIEETIRFLKQSYQVEDIRLLTYHRLQNMMAILTAVAYFAMVYLGLKTKMRVLARHVMGAARRIFGIPDFHFYALADGIREYLFARQSGLEGFHNQWLEENKQLGLFDP
jgi:hypothetical protein